LTPVPRCRCAVCHSRLRVLPIQIAPFKHYTRQVIESGCTAYSDAQLPGITLRRVVAWMGPGHPDHSALHGWLAGLGERALGRLDPPASAMPVSALIAETAKHHDRGVAGLWTQRYPVAERKYRSDRRREQLEGCARVFATATDLFSKARHPLFEWEHELQERLHVAAWSFPARCPVPSFQQQTPHGFGVQCVWSPQNPKSKERNRSHGARSPP
jgi:hypothetical protein